MGGVMAASWLSCHGCGKVDTAHPNAVPPTWLQATVYWDGRERLMVACSADCVEAAREFTRQHWQVRLGTLDESLSLAKFKRLVQS